MKRQIGLLVLLIPALVVGQVTVKGVVTEQNSGNRPIGGVQIKVLGAAPEATGNDGLFRLMFTGKKPGDRIIVSEIAKPGFEIVNKDVVNSWLVPGDPELRTRIVMCPEGLIAENTLKYYNISLAGLTKAYEARVASLKQQVDQAQIDRKTYMEQTRNLEEQYEKQQTQLEELAEKFARENFDDCDAIHQQAFEAFKLGDIIGAIRILESVNSKEEIEKAMTQKSKSYKLEQEAVDMRIHSDSIIQQNIKKLIFQGDLYKSEFRFGEAEEAYETAVQADTTIFLHLNKYVDILKDQKKWNKGLRWSGTELAAAKTAKNTAHALWDLGSCQHNLNQLELAEKNYSEAIRIYRELVANDPDGCYKCLSVFLRSLARLQSEMKMYRESEAGMLEALTISKNLYDSNTKKYADNLEISYHDLGRIYQEMDQQNKAMEIFALGRDICYHSIDLDPQEYKHHYMLAKNLHGMGTASIVLKNFQQAELFVQEALDVILNQPSLYTDYLMHEIAHLYSTLAYIQNRIDKKEQAENNYIQSLSIYRKIYKINPEEYEYSFYMVLRNISVFHLLNKHYEKAEILLNESFPLARKLANKQPDKYNIALTDHLFFAGTLFCRWGYPEKATPYYDEMLQLLRGWASDNPAVYHVKLAGRLSDAGYELHKTHLPLAIAYTDEAIQILQPGADSLETYQEALTSCYFNTWWYRLLLKDFTGAERYARMCQEKPGYPEHSARAIAHCLLFQSRYDEAEKLYLEISPKASARYGTKTYRDVILEDLDELEQAGVTHPDVEKIRKKIATSRELRVEERNPRRKTSNK